jgi:osmoprotectant transport system permease protein
LTTLSTEPVDTTARDADPAATSNRGSGRARLDRETIVLLAGLPVLVLVVLGGWIAWRLNAHLDSIEQRPLAWVNVLHLTWQHVLVTLTASVIVLAVAIPLGVLVTRPRFRRAAPVAVGLANMGQSAPAIGLIVLLALWWSFGFWTAVAALSFYGILPVLRNTIAGLQSVDPTLVEAGRGIGMSGTRVLLRVELPLAVPVIMAGVRTSLVLVVGTATFVTFVSAGGLGSLITTGVELFRFPVLVSGALLVAVLALAVEWVGRVLEALVRPKGL